VNGPYWQKNLKGCGHSTTHMTPILSTEATEKNGTATENSTMIVMTDNDTYEYVTTGNVNTLPMDASPTDVMYTEAGWRVSQHLPMRAKEIKKIITRNFMEYLGSQEEHIAQYYTQIEFFVVPYEI
jgi:hypothetical protein